MRGQVAIFVIISIIIITSLASYIIFRLSQLQEIPEASSENLPAFLESCIQNELKEIMGILFRQGGELNVSFGKNVDGNMLPYLCYNENDYLPCVNQKPLLVRSVKAEIEKASPEPIQRCFDEFSQKMLEDGYGVKKDYSGLSARIQDEKILLLVNLTIFLDKKENSIKIVDPEFVIDSDLGKIIFLVQEMASQEARFCYFEAQGFELLYPEYDVTRFKMGEGDILHKIKSKRTAEQFSFLTRGCAIRGGS